MLVCRSFDKVFIAILTGFVSLTFVCDEALGGGNGSLLIFPDVEISWDSNGVVTQDTLINLSNGFTQEVNIRMYFVNGDPPLNPVMGPSGIVIERGHPGWNQRGCQIDLSGYEATYWSALTGQPDGCRFAGLDAGPPPGRPDPEHPGGRTLRGFLYMWAVDEEGREINWNYLRGDATVFQFPDGAAWGYEAASFRALTGTRGQVLPDPGTLHLDGVEYEQAFATLHMNFSAVGEVPLFGDDRLFQVDTDLTLMPVSQDFRQDTSGPITTKAKFDIVNMEETQFSGTDRCITCWDQSLLSRYDAPNNFVYEDIHTEVGAARITGMASSVVCGPQSTNQALLGVAVRVISFPSLRRAADWTGDGTTNLGDTAAFAACLAGPHAESGDAVCPLVFDVDGDGDVDVRDFSAIPFAVQVDRSYSAVNLIGEGARSAIIRYDAPN